MLIVTGMSGSGKSIVLKTLEDLGYYCVDNLPLAFLEEFTVDFACNNEQPVAVAIDVRNGVDLNFFPSLVESLKNKCPIKVLFLNTNNQTLIKRYSESRRPHPLNVLGGTRVSSAIEAERKMLDSICNIADRIIDTSEFNNKELKESIANIYQIEEKILQINIQSFGFKKGIPLNADYVFDVRFLPNPYWEKTLRNFNGKQIEIQNWLSQFPQSSDFISDTTLFLKKWIPQFMGQDRTYLSIAFGCTGGKHRSVYVAEQIAHALKNDFPSINIQHPDIDE